KLQRTRSTCVLRRGRLFQDDVDVGPAKAKRAGGGAAHFLSPSEGDELVSHNERAAGKLDLGIGLLEMEGRRNLFVMKNESRFDQARNSGGISRMPNVSLDGADI